MSITLKLLGHNDCCYVLKCLGFHVTDDSFSIPVTHRLQYGLLLLLMLRSRHDLFTTQVIMNKGDYSLAYITSPYLAVSQYSFKFKVQNAV